MFRKTRRNENETHGLLSKIVKSMRYFFAFMKNYLYICNKKYFNIMHYFEKNNLKMNGFYIVYNAGSIYEDNGKAGTMHLMEHLICKQLDDMQNEFTKRCINFNAYTNEQHVVVHLTGLNTQLNSDVKLKVIEKLTNGVFADINDFNKEKEIVLQEYYNYFNDVLSGNIANYLRTKFNNFSVIGTAEDISNFTYEEALSVFNTYFKNPSHVIEIGKEKTNLSHVTFNDIQLSKKLHKFKNYNNTLEIVPNSDTNSIVIVTSKKTISKKDYPIFSILIDILTDGLNSPLYQELREKRGLVYGIFPCIIPCVNDSIFMLSAMTTKENTNQVTQIITDILSNLKNFITEDRFIQVINNHVINLEINNIFNYKKPKNIYKNLPSNFKTKKQLLNVTFNDIINIGNKYFNNLDVLCI